jgi:two-component system sensor histidine kinase KdpD
MGRHHNGYPAYSGNYLVLRGHPYGVFYYSWTIRRSIMNFIKSNQVTLVRIGKTLLFSALILIITQLIRAFTAISTPSTAAFSFLIIVLLSAFFGDIFVAIITSIVAALCFDYFFLPPFETFHIAAYSDWVSLIAFLVTSAIISHLTASAAENATAVKEIKKAMEQLEEFAKFLLATPYDQLTLSGIAFEALHMFSLEYCSIHVYSEGKWSHFTGSAESSISEEVKNRLKLVQDHPTQLIDYADDSLVGVQFMQINRGTTPVALLAIKSSTLPSEAIGVMAYMIGVRLNTITKNQ